MRIRVFGVSLGVGALLCGCGVLTLFFDGGCPRSSGICPSDSFSEHGGQCVYTYYEFDLPSASCLKKTATAALPCTGDPGLASLSIASPSKESPLAATANPYTVNQLQTFLDLSSGPAPFDVKFSMLDLPFRPVLPAATVQSGNVACNPAVTVLSVGPNRGTVLPINPCNRTVGTGIPTGAGSLQVGITTDAQFAFVTNVNGTIPVIDLKTRTIVTTIQTPGARPFGIAMSPDGALAYVTSLDTANPSMLVVDVARRAVTSTIKLSALPQNIFVSPDGTLIWITSQIPDVITVLDALTYSPVATINSVISPTGLAFNPTGTTAYVASATSPGTVKEIDTKDYTVVKSYTVGNNPVDVRMGNPGFVVVLNRTSDFLSHINVQTGEVTSEVSNLVPNAPHAGLALIQ